MFFLKVEGMSKKFMKYVSETLSYLKIMHMIDYIILQEGSVG
jgi:hypothetical protein